MGAADGDLHRDRARAESFGVAAAEYDRFRPDYPDALFADLLAGRPAQVLDIGAGTGKASRQVAGPGRSVLCVEPDAAMAAVARSSGLEVEIAAFESWDPSGRAFDLVMAAQAWHWVDPLHGARKVASLLVPGGLFACFWNYPLPHPLHDAVAEVQRRVAPEHEFGVVDVGSTEEPYADDLRSAGVFSEVALKRYVWEEALPAPDWVGRLATRSDYLRLPAGTRAALLAEVERVVASYEPLRLPYGTYAIFARPA